MFETESLRVGVVITPLRRVSPIITVLPSAYSSFSSFHFDIFERNKKRRNI